jgi:dienelactone hydrolase
VAIPQILAWMDAEQVVSAFKLAREVQEVLPDDPVFVDLWQKLAGSTSVTTNPPGARVSIRDWNAVDGQWLSIGTTPIEQIELPAGPLRWKFEKEGFVARESQLKSLPKSVGSTLINEAKHPGMAGVAPLTFDGEEGERTLSAFLIDKHEVTNRDYQKFVDAGGYHNSDYWRDEFVDEHGEPIDGEAAMRSFIDATGQPGPKLWRDGRYPTAQDEYPVRGVSWYEAMAFARFAGKMLPTQNHWRWSAYGENKHIRPLSNMNSLGPDPVEHNQGIGIFGVYDMLGNVKEWCFNKHGDRRRCLLGADWKSPSYMAGTIDSAPPMARGESYGFRCARYRAEGIEWAFRPYVPSDIAFSPPATAEEIEQFLRLYEYDRGQRLGASLVTVDRDPSDAELRHEIVQIDAAYGEERFDVHLLIPRRGRPPFQAILWFPGVSSIQKQSQEERRKTMEFTYERAMAKTGRIVCSPVYQGMYERNLKSLEGTVRQRDWRIQMTKDLFRAVDYLETRADIDSETLVYCGLSMGAALAPCHLVAEPRLKLAVLFAGGAKGGNKSPEVDPMRFAPHVKIPLVVLNGQFDGIFRYEDHQLPFFDRLGSADKHLELYPTNHAPPVDESVGFADQWIRQRTKRPD